MAWNETPVGPDQVSGMRVQIENALLFRGVGLDTVAYLLPGCRVVTLAIGEPLLTRTARNDSVFVLLEGRLRVHLTHPGEAAVAHIDPGGCAGEMSVIDGEGVSADVVADEPSRLLRIPQDVLWAMVNISHGVARNLLFVLSTRMRQDNAIIIQKTHEQRASERAALVDALTGLHNRRWLEDAFPRQMVRCAEDARAFSLVMIDIDHFKRVNDTWGHVRGDEVLVAVARALAEHIRPGDLLARYGGEEFSLGLPTANLNEGRAVAERLRTAVASLVLPFRGADAPPHVTASFGVATMAPGEAITALIARADAALYRSKEGGRNRVTTDA